MQKSQQQNLQQSDSSTNSTYKAVVCDLDGTLLNAEHRIGELTVHTLSTLAKQGIDIYIATGRNHPDVLQIAKKLNIAKVTLITSNGARADYLSGEKIVQHHIADDIAKALFQIPHTLFPSDFDPEQIYMNSYQGDDWYISAEIPEWRSFFDESGYGYKLADFPNHPVSEVEKVFFIAKNIKTPEILHPIEQHIQSNFADKLQLTYSMPHCFEIMAKGVNKGTTLNELMAKKGYGLADCIAFGDGLNDVEMLSQASTGCIMANASDKVKQTLPHLQVIGHHGDEAVARHLQEVFAELFA